MSRSICLFAALVAPVLLHAGDTPRDRATLKGATSVSVIIDVLPADFGKEGVTAELLRDRLTQRLREVNVPLEDSAKEFLGLRISSVRDTRGPYAVAISLGFYQPVTLTRDPAVRLAPPTWDADSVLMAPAKVLSRAVLESIDDLANRFISAWRSVNGLPPDK